MKGKFLLIRDDQQRFIEDQSQRFNLSKFVRAKLDEYIKMVENGEKRVE